MNVKLTITSDNKIWDLTNTVESISINTSMYDSPGKCEFSLLGNRSFPKGSIVQLVIDDAKVFYGYVFIISLSSDEKTNVTAYDQLRYLKNQDTLYYEGMTASQIFEDICKKNNLKSKVIDTPSWPVLGYLYDKKTMFDIIKHAIDETFRMTSKKYMIRDNFGTIEFIDIANQKTNLLIGSGSLLTSFDYTTSIDEDTYNYVKLIRDNKETKKRDSWVSKSAKTIAKWGKLQFLQSIDEHANEEQIKELANNILIAKDRETRSLSLNALGFYNIKAGDGIKVKIGDVIDEWFYLSSVNTTIEHQVATMDLEVFII